eukprot:1248120-Amphidinium_carterae.1
MTSSGTTTTIKVQSTIHSNQVNNHNLCSTLVCLECARQVHLQSTMLVQHSSIGRSSSILNHRDTYVTFGQ